jgi:hypothetical protein
MLNRAITSNEHEIHRIEHTIQELEGNAKRVDEEFKAVLSKEKSTDNDLSTADTYYGQWIQMRDESQRVNLLKNHVF